MDRRGWGGSIFWKPRDTALYSTRVPRSGFPGFHMAEQKNVFLAVNGVSLGRLDGENGREGGRGEWKGVGRGE